MLGVAGDGTDPQAYGRLTGRKHYIRGTFLEWGQGQWTGRRTPAEWLEMSAAGNYRMMFHFNTSHNGRELITPYAMSRGAGDSYLMLLSRNANESGQFVYIRPMAEMNGHWNLYSAYNKNGTRRNAAHSTAAYRQAFRRTTLIMRGGSVAAINKRLGAVGMPALRTSKTTLPRSGKVAIVWNPQGEGSPNVRGNQPRDYYPGRAFVDYVANDLYAQNYRAHWRAQNSLYASFPHHPFMMGEWAPWGTDDPAFVRQMFDWVRTHPRTKALIYFHGSTSTAFPLAYKPKSLAAYRTHARQARYNCPTCGAFG